MAYSIKDGNMSADISNGTVVDVRGKRVLLVRAEWPGTGSPQGLIGLKVGPDPARLTSIGSVVAGSFNGGFPLVGAQPSGVAAAGYLMFELQNGAEWAQAFYDQTGGGVGNTGLQVEITGN